MLRRQPYVGEERRLEIKSLILVKDVGRFAKPEGDTGIWGGYPQVPAPPSFMPWSSSLSCSLIPKSQQLIIKVFPLGQISSFSSDSESQLPRMPQGWEGAGAWVHLTQGEITQEPSTPWEHHCPAQLLPHTSRGSEVFVFLGKWWSSVFGELCWPFRATCRGDLSSWAPGELPKEELNILLH